MAHPEQIDFCTRVQKKYPELFNRRKVLDVGSLDINGNNRYLFYKCEYTGIDVGPGRNVDVVSLGHEFDAPDETYEVIISTECFEHDMHYPLTLKNIVRMLKPGGMFLFTCATTGRAEHGTRRSAPDAAPLLSGEWSDYYKNLTEQDIRECIDVDDIFAEYYFEVNDGAMKDLYFYGIKK